MRSLFHRHRHQRLVFGEQHGAVRVALAYSLPAFAIPVALGYLTGSVVDYRQALGALTTITGGRQ